MLYVVGQTMRIFIVLVLVYFLFTKDHIRIRFLVLDYQRYSVSPH